jgi:two-component system, LytTR family, response regulator
VTAVSRVLIADDEAPARARIRQLLADQERFTVVAESDSGSSTLNALRRARPDLAFLDVQMPGGSGIEILSEIEPENRPVIIFTTAFERYALEAFEARAIDYLLKPYTDERFLDALRRADVLLRGNALKDWQRRVLHLLRDLPNSVSAPAVAESSRGRPLERFAVRDRDRIILVDVADVSWIGSSGDYLMLHTESARHLTRMTMQDAEERLNGDQFMRIHRSALVRLSNVQALEPFSRSEDICVLRDGTRLRVSRRYRSALRLRLGLE